MQSTWKNYFDFDSKFSYVIISRVLVVMAFWDQTQSLITVDYAMAQATRAQATLENTRKTTLEVNIIRWKLSVNEFTIITMNT